MDQSLTPAESSDLSQRYGARYFRTYRGAPYERSPRWLATFVSVAEGIVRDIRPIRVLDAGCAMGLLVEALRDRHVDAWGFDISDYAISQVRHDIAPYCRVGSLLDAPSARYDLVVCSEVIEHLPAADAERAVANLCAQSDDVLFSSSPDVYDEDTHLNVRPPEYWASLFAQHGFIRDLDFDGASFLAPWAVRFRKNANPPHRVVGDYERRLWTLTREVAALRKRALDSAAELARHDARAREQIDGVSAEQTIADQQEHLDALNARLQFMSDHEAELRQMLFDAHQQLLERDRLLQGGAGPISYITAVRRILKPLVPAQLRPVLRRAVGLKS